MAALRARLFGKFSIQHEEQRLDGLEGRKVQELFCYLLIFRDQAHSREALANLLWSDCTTTQSRSYLRKALWQLQASLDPSAGLLSTPIMQVDTDWVQLNLGTELWLDVAFFEQALTQVRGRPGETLTGEQAIVLQQAVTLYQGNLLEGWYQDWCLYERERLQQMYLGILDKLMTYCEAQQEYERGLDYGDQILRVDRARECTHRALMRLHYLVGDRTGALRQYERCVAILQEELDVRPTPYTAELYEQIKVNQFVSPPATLPPPVAPPRRCFPTC